MRLRVGVKTIDCIGVLCNLVREWFEYRLVNVWSLNNENEALHKQVSCFMENSIAINLQRFCVVILSTHVQNNP